MRITNESGQGRLEKVSTLVRKSGYEPLDLISSLCLPLDANLSEAKKSPRMASQARAGFRRSSRLSESGIRRWPEPGLTKGSEGGAMAWSTRFGHMTETDGDRDETQNRQDHDRNKNQPVP